MESIGVKELRDHLSRILREVEQGRVVRVSRHGKGVVELRPVRTEAQKKIVNRLREADLLGGGTGKVGPVKTVRNRTPDRPVSDLVREDRR